MASPMYSPKSQRAIFTGFWKQFSTQIINRQGTVDFPTDDELLPHHITTVIRLPQHLANELFEKLATVCTDDYHYPSTDIHMTLLNLDKLLDYQKDIDWGSLANAIHAAIEGLPELHFRLKGIGVFPTTIFAQAYDESGALEQYRSAIAKAVIGHHPLDINPNEIKALVPGITFANVIRFKQKPNPEIIQVINNLRDFEMGSFRPKEFEIVTTDKLFSANHTVVHTTLQLAP
jgi:2'-5' RNA ligase